MSMRIQREESYLIRKGLAILVIILFISMVLIPSTVSKVEQSSISTLGGDILYVGGGGPGNYSRIQDAIDDANPGDTVFVYDDSSPYYEHVVIYKSIKLIGEKKDTTIIDGGYELEVIYVTADEVTITGFTLTNGRNIALYGSSNHSNVSDNIFIGNHGAIALGYSSNNTISGNIIDSGYGLGIGFYYTSNDNSICGNFITNSEIGIIIAVSFRNKVAKNIVKDSYVYGIAIAWSFFNSIKENNFIENNQNGYFENSALNFWRRNYWDDWSGFGPKLISGIIYLPWDYNKFIPWINFDWRPAKVPYDY